jgi:hypothetical protein
MPSRGYEKGDYQPEADWASYGPESGFGGAGSVEERERAQDEAWRRAEANGPTAHLTGNGARGRDEARRQSGYVVASNQEEDEAWEQARTEGVTAHLTGSANGPRNLTGSGKIL